MIECGLIHTDGSDGCEKFSQAAILRVPGHFVGMVPLLHLSQNVRGINARTGARKGLGENSPRQYCK